MEAYLISVFISSVGFVFLSFAVFLLLLFTKARHKIGPFKALLVMLAFSIGFGAIQPSNTGKFEAVRSPNPIERQVEKQIMETPPILEQGKQERKERFEEITDWRSKNGN